MLKYHQAIYQNQKRYLKNKVIENQEEINKLIKKRSKGKCGEKRYMNSQNFISFHKKCDGQTDPRGESLKESRVNCLQGIFGISPKSQESHKI